MSAWARSTTEAVERLERHDATLKIINLYSKQLTDAQLVELVDCLLAHPDVVIGLYLAYNELTDETGVKLAHYLAASSTVRSLELRSNQFSEVTYLALAAALRVNSSLRLLSLNENQAVDRTRIDAAFIEALQLNPNQKDEFYWFLYSNSNEFERLNAVAEHPSLQALLALLC